MDLDEFTEVYKQEENDFKDRMKTISKEISLDSVLRKIEPMEPLEPYDGHFLFRVSHYHIFVSEQAVQLIGFQGVLDREFKGEEIKPIYDNILNKYEEIKKQKIFLVDDRPTV